MDTFEAGLEALRSDERIRRRARVAMEMTVNERLAEAVAALPRGHPSLGGGDRGRGGPATRGAGYLARRFVPA